MTFGAAKFQVVVKEVGGRGSDLNVQLMLSGEKVNMLTAPKSNIELCVSVLYMNILTYRYYSSCCSFCCIIIAFSVEQAGIMGLPIGQSHDFCRAYSTICTLAPLGRK